MGRDTAPERQPDGFAVVLQGRFGLVTYRRDCGCRLCVSYFASNSEGSVTAAGGDAASTDSVTGDAGRPRSAADHHPTPSTNEP